MRTLLTYLLSVLSVMAFGQGLQASFDVEVLEGTTQVVVTNTTQGSFDYSVWSFGDGTVVQDNAAVLTHTYADLGTYIITLVVWKEGQQSSASDTVQIDGGDPCGLMDCVWPGDCNLDGVADFRDVLHISLAYGAQGPPRPAATIGWYGQPAPDWAQTTGDGINYKHLDTNGDGNINSWDLVAIVEENYTPLSNSEPVYENDWPLLAVGFTSDSMFVEPGQVYEVTAHVLLGSVALPATQFYGLAFRIDLPEDLVPFIQNVAFDYNPMSFMGSDLEVLSITKQSGSQIDVVLTRKTGINVYGFGELGLLRFIIIGDIIDGREMNTVNLPVALSGIRGISEDGTQIDISFSPEPSEIVFQGYTSGAGDVVPRRAVVQPNPVNEWVIVSAAGLRHVTVTDVSGRAVARFDITSDQQPLEVSALDPGTYFVTCRFADGSSETHKIVKR